MTGSPLFFDLETVPDERRASSFRLPPVPPIPGEWTKTPTPESVLAGSIEAIKSSLAPVNGMVAPVAWLDQLTAAEKAGKNRAGVHDVIARARAAKSDAANAVADRCKLLSTTPEFCRIAALGWAVGDDGRVCSGVAADPDGETELLDKFWSLVAETGGPLVGFNVLAFDLPVIFVRSAILNIPGARMFDLKAWGKDVVDVYALRFGGRGAAGGDRPGKLKDLAPLMGIDVPADGVDGSQVYEMLHADPAKVAEYVKSDVEITRKYYQKLRGFFWA